MKVQETPDNRFDVYFARDMADFLTDLAAQLKAQGIDPATSGAVIDWAAARFRLQATP